MKCLEAQQSKHSATLSKQDDLDEAIKNINPEDKTSQVSNASTILKLDSYPPR